MVNHRQTVLLVEDDPFARRLVKSYLERMGLLVVEAADGKSALRRLTEMVPDLTCLDLVLPECSGYEVCEFIQRTPAIRDTPILVMSGRSLPEDRAHAIEAGASAYLIKPFTRAEFTKQVDVLLRGSAAKRISSQFGVRQPPRRRATDVPAPARFAHYLNFRNYLSYAAGSVGRHKLLALVTFALVVLGTLGSLYVLPADYFVETRIWAQRSQPVATLDNRRPANQTEAESPTRAANETILRRDNLVALIKQTGAIANWKMSTFPIPWLKARLIGLVRGRPTDEDRVSALAGILEQKMWVVAGESTVTIGLIWPDGPMAYQLVEAARQSFREARYVSDISDIAETISILEGHAKSARESIEASLEEIQRAREAAASKRSVQFEPRKAEPANSELAQIQGMLAAKRRDIKEVRGFHQRYSTELQSHESARLASLQKEEQQLLAEYLQRGGKMEDLAIEERPKPPLDTVRIRREASSPGDDPSLDAAKAHLNSALSKYERLLERIEGANLELDSARTSFTQRYTVILPAQMPRKRVTPTVPLMAGLIAALLTAIAAAVVVDFRAGRIVEVWQIEQQLSLPVLGHVPKVSLAAVANEVTGSAAAPHAETSRRGYRSSAP